MKSPFAILIAVVVLLGIGIGVAAIIFVGPTNRDDDADTIPIASESDLPTPSTRNEAARAQTDTAEKQSAVVVVSTSVTTEDISSDELPSEIQERVESVEAQVVVTVETSGEASGRGGFGGGSGFGGGGGGPNVQAIQEAMESNPEIQELIQKAQSGSMSQEDQARLRELMQEALADAGIEAPGGRQGGGGFGAPPIQGTISAISGSTLTINHNDDSGVSTDVDITDNTNISVISQLTPADLTEGANVAGTVQRGEGGRIFIVNLAVLPEQQEQGFGGGFRGLFGGAPQGANDATNLSSINGTIAEVNDQTISVETTQGALRLTANEDSNIVATSSGSLSDITEGMAAIAFGGNQPVIPAQAGTPIQPSNLIAGPESLLQSDATPRTRGQRAQGNQDE